MVLIDDILINEDKILWCIVDKQIPFLGLDFFSEEAKEELKDIYTITIGFENGEEKTFFNFTEAKKDRLVECVMRSCYENKHKQK